MSGSLDPDVRVDEEGNPYLLVAGLRVYLVAADDAEQSEFVVCAPTGFFADDIHTTCASCGDPVVHRPYAPVRPPKICIACAIKQVQVSS